MSQMRATASFAHAQFNRVSAIDRCYATLIVGETRKAPDKNSKILFGIDKNTSF